MAGTDLGDAGTAPAVRPPVRARRLPFWRELAFLLAARLAVVVKAWAVEAFRMPAAIAQRGLAAPPRRGLVPLPMAVGLAGMLPLAWACRRQSAHVAADRR